MNYSDLIIFIMEILGTVSFASSGAMLGIRRKMDFFGVNVLGITTAVGGGMIRDLILGITPPAMFQNSVYAMAAIITSTVLFIVVYFVKRWGLFSAPQAEAPEDLTGSPSPKRRSRDSPEHSRESRNPLGGYLNERAFSQSFIRWYDRVMLFCDTVGLGIFTVMGSYAAVRAGYGENHFLVIFVGVLTGVGGGVVRDMMAGTMPYIFLKHVYAVASLAGALLYSYLYPHMDNLTSMMIGASAVIAIRFLAAYYRWNLPRVN